MSESIEMAARPQPGSVAPDRLLPPGGVRTAGEAGADHQAVVETPSAQTSADTSTTATPTPTTWDAWIAETTGATLLRHNPHAAGNLAQQIAEADERRRRDAELWRAWRDAHPDEAF